MSTETVVPITRKTTKRTSVPAPVAPAASPALVELTGGSQSTVQIAIGVLRSHPANPRRDLGDLTELTDSIRAHGVRQNLLVVPDPDEAGAYRLIIGHRRAAAARVAGLTHLAAVIDPTLTPADQLELMLLENIQRQDLSPIEEADAYQGLLDLGIDEAAIATKTGRSRTTVKARLALRTVPEAAREKLHTHQATIADAELLAKTLARKDVASAPETAAEIEAAFGLPSFASTLEDAIDELERRAERAKIIADLTAAGVTLIEAGHYGSIPKGVKQLNELTDDKKPTHRSPALAVESHASCPGHVAWLNSWSAQVFFGCRDWKQNGHGDRYASQRVPASGEPDVDRKTLIANNKAAMAAEPVRRRWLHRFLTASLTDGFPADALIYAAQVLRVGHTADHLYGQLYDELRYGKNVSEHDRLADLTDPTRATAHFIALAATHVESQMPKDYWRKGDNRRGLFVVYLTTLASWGYELADVEREYLDKAAGKTPKAARS